MKQKQGFVPIILIVLALAAGVALWYFNLLPFSLPGTSPSQQAAVTKVTGEGMVTITSTGFVPSTIKVTKGTQITWTNTDTKPHQVKSDPYPSGSLLPALDSDVLSPKDSSSFVFEKSGTFTYHDQLNPLKFKGTVIVQ